MTQDRESMLREALEHLAADPVSQAGYLQQVGTWPSLDELALEFDDLAEAAESPAARTAQAALGRLSMFLDTMSGEANAKLWEPEALSGPEWSEVRALAAAALAAMDGP